MFKRTTDLHVACSPEQAFTHIAREFFTNHPRWDPDIVELTQTSPGPMAEGTTGLEVREFNGRRFETPFRITRFEPDRAFSHRSSAGAMGEDVDYLIEADGAGALVRSTVEIYPRTLMLRLLSPLIKPRVEKNFRANLERFRQLLDGLAAGVS